MAPAHAPTVKTQVPATDVFAHGFRQVVLLITWLVILPSVVLLAFTMLIPSFAEKHMGGIFIILLLTLVACLITGSVLALILVRREARLATMQTDFISKVSHELRTPLTAIAMLVDTVLLERTANAEETRQCLEAVRQETTLLRGQIERMLDWGRMEAGHKSYAHDSVAVDDIIEEAVAALSPIVHSRQQAIEVKLSSTEFVVTGDHQALVDAMTNLLANASKFSRRGQTIEIGASMADDRAHLWVRDHGAGIPEREHRRIFKRFYRIDDRLSRNTEGSGLGLAIVHHIVKGHRGHVEVESAPDQGSTFTIVLPVGESTR